MPLLFFVTALIYRISSIVAQSHDLVAVLNAHVNKHHFVGLYIVMTLTQLCLTLNF